MLIRYAKRHDFSLPSVQYEFEEDIIKATIGETTEIFDFAEFQEDGILQEIETELPINPVISAERVDGELKVVLLQLYPSTTMLPTTPMEFFNPLQEVAEDESENNVED